MLLFESYKINIFNKNVFSSNIGHPNHVGRRSVWDWLSTENHAHFEPHNPSVGPEMLQWGFSLSDGGTSPDGDNNERERDVQCLYSTVRNLNLFSLNYSVIQCHLWKLIQFIYTLYTSTISSHIIKLQY